LGTVQIQVLGHNTRGVAAVFGYSLIFIQDVSGLEATLENGIYYNTHHSKSSGGFGFNIGLYKPTPPFN
jgi:hypothetical protein